MNCQQCQDKILESLALGVPVLEPESAAHQNSCASCREFYAAQQNLFRSIDTGLHSLANQPVPALLVATLRTRLDEAQAATLRFPRWIPAAAALLLAFLLTMPILLQTNKVVAPRLALHSPGPPRLSPNSESVDRSSSVEPLSSRISANRVPRHEIGRSKSSAAAPAVLIDHREAQALASLATAVQQTPEWGTGLLQPAALPPADLKALPAIEIADLKVAPLTEERW